jgi:hypothetical protein
MSIIESIKAALDGKREDPSRGVGRPRNFILDDYMKGYTDGSEIALELLRRGDIAGVEAELKEVKGHISIVYMRYSGNDVFNDFEHSFTCGQLNALADALNLFNEKQSIFEGEIIRERRNTLEGILREMRNGRAVVLSFETGELFDNIDHVRQEIKECESLIRPRSAARALNFDI